MCMSPSEPNVFVLENKPQQGLQARGVAIAEYRTSEEEHGILSEGSCFCLTAEVRVQRLGPGGGKPSGSSVLPPCFGGIVLDLKGLEEKSSSSDFLMVSLRPDSQEIRIENHRKNGQTSTLFSQPVASLSKQDRFVALKILVKFENSALSISLGGVPLLPCLNVSKWRAFSPPLSLGVAVGERAKICVKRFKVEKLNLFPSDKPLPKAQPLTGEKVMQIAQNLAVGPLLPAMSSPLGFPSTFSKELELVELIEKDIISSSLGVEFEDISGLSEAKRALQESLVLPLLLPDFYKGIREPWKGVLLFGPPGTGKTMLAKAVASSLVSAQKVTFFNCSVASLTSKWRGESEKLLRCLFETARVRAPSVLFFDEMDSVLGQRGTGAEHEASRRFKSEFLIHMDGLLSSSTAHILVLCTSNAPWMLDEALRRRLEKRIHIPLPTLEERESMFKRHLESLPLSPSLDFSELARRSEGFSGSDLKILCREASMEPMRRLLLETGGDAAQAAQKYQALLSSGKGGDGEGGENSVFAKRDTLESEFERSPEVSGEEAEILRISEQDLSSAFERVKPSVGREEVEKHRKWAEIYGST